MTIAEPRPRVTPDEDDMDLLGVLCDKLAELMEVSVAEIEVDQPLMHIGADSLVLMEAITFLEQRYQIRLKAGQVIEELDTLEKLAAHISRTRQDVVGGGSRDVPSSAPVGGTDECDEIVEIVGQVPELELPELPEHNPITPVALAATDVEDDDQRVEVAGEETRSESFVSWRASPSAPAAAAPVTADPAPNLIDAFSEKLRGSKTHADRYRPTHADPRSSAFIRRSTKEVTVPLVMSRAEGSKVWDIDGHEYLDMTMGFGSLLFGHGYEPITTAVQRQLRAGVGIGPVPYLSGPVSESVCRLTNQDRVMFVASGTEAVMLATRVARFATGRRRIAMFRGSYHGWWDGTLVSPGDGPGGALPAVGGTVGSPTDDVLLLPWGDPNVLETLEACAGSLAGILVEPVQSRSPHLQPRELIEQLRVFATKHGIPLIFDEMITGFRMAAGGAAEVYGVSPDLVTFGKALGGGMPLGCVAGRSDLLDTLDGGPWKYGDRSMPEADMTFGAGTFAKHPLSMAAAWAVTEEVTRLGTDLYRGLELRAERLQSEVNEVFAAHGVQATLTRCGSLFRFSSKQNLDAFYAALIHNGCYLWEGRSMFLSYVHDDKDLTRFVEGCDIAIRTITGAANPREASRPAAPQCVAAPPDTVQDATPAREAEQTAVVEFPLTPNQRQLAFAYLGNTSAAQGFHNVAVVQFEGPLDVERLRRVLDVVSQRHDSFRTTFDLRRNVELLHKDRTSTRLRVHDVISTGTARDNEIAELVERACTEPFDLENGPLWRFELVMESDTKAQMVMACSDLVADGWSLSMVLSEFAALYESEITGADPSLPEAGRLADLRDWLDSDTRRAEIQQSMLYWENVLGEADLSPALPPTHARTGTSYSKTRAKRTVDAQTMERVAATGRAEGVTQFSVLLGAFAALIHLVGGRDDFIIGIPTTGRPANELRTVVASLAIPVPIRVSIAPGMTAADLLRSVQRNVFLGVDNAAPVEELARQRSRATGRLDPITPVMFNLDPVREVPAFSDGVNLTLGSPERSFGLLPFSAEACPRNDGSMSVSFDAAVVMYDEAMVQAWADYYIALLETVITDPSTPLTDITLGGIQ
jgi:glutamate-1-semialdehyde aminotransferase/acyl carrier protein